MHQHQQLMTGNVICVFSIASFLPSMTHHGVRQRADVFTIKRFAVMFHRP
jgi:hypothetical protein